MLYAEMKDKGGPTVLRGQEDTGGDASRRNRRGRRQLNKAKSGFHMVRGDREKARRAQDAKI